MITPKYLKIVNFGVFEDVEYRFDGKPKSVLGDNKTDDGQESNGSGKSWLQGGVEYVNLGTNSRKETGKGLIRWGESSGYVEFHWYCDVRDEVLIIVREQKKSGAKLNLYRNDKEHEIESSTVKDGDERILRWLGTTKDDFLSYYVLTQIGYKSFFATTGGNTNRLALVSRIADISFFDEIEDDIKRDVSKKETDIKELHSQISKLDGKIEEAEANIESMMGSGDNKEDKEDVIRSLHEKIGRIKADIESVNITVGIKEKEVEASKLTLGQKEIELKEFQETISDGEQLGKDLSDYNKEISELNRDIIEAEKNIQGKVNCPKCSFEFVIGRADVNIGVEESIIKDCQEIIYELKLDKEDVEKEIADIDKKKREERKLKRDVANIEDSISSLDRSINSSLDRADDMKLEIKRAENRIESIRTETPIDNQKLIKEAQIKAGDYQKELVGLNKKLSLAEDEELFELKQWKTNFQRFKMYLANDTIKLIQDTCNFHLSKMNSDLLVKIDGFKIKADGSLKEEVTPLVIRDSEHPFYSYSKGERCRVEFAMIMAIQDIINGLNPYGGVAFLAADEIFEGLDGLGLKHLMKSIQNVGQDVWLTTHIKDDRVTSDTIVIEKNNGIGNIKID